MRLCGIPGRIRHIGRIGLCIRPASVILPAGRIQRTCRRLPAGHALGSGRFLRPH